MTQAKTNKKNSASPRSLPTSNLSHPTSAVSLSHHQRNCSICRHPDRAEIEDEFLRWHMPEQIAEDYKISDRSCVYRHAHALGLVALRKRNLRFVLENILERVDEVQLTADSVIRAVQAYARVTDAGDWVEPTRCVHVSHGGGSQDQQPGTLIETSQLRAREPLALPDPEISNSPEEAAVAEPIEGADSQAE